MSFNAKSLTPTFSVEQIQNFALRHYHLFVTSIKELPSYEDQNFFLQVETGEKYVLKIMALGTDLAKIDLEHQVMLRLNQSTSNLQFPQPLPSQNGENIIALPYNDKQSYYMRLLTWIEGYMMVEANPCSEELLEDLGRACGLVSKELKGFDHSAAHRIFKWDNAQAIWTKKHIHLFQKTEDSNCLDYFIRLYEQEALPHLKKLPTSVAHSDLNDFNILITSNLRSPKIAGLIDFGDVVYTQTINELAICIAYNCMNKKDPLKAACQILKGYHTVFPVTDEELKVLFPLIAIRMVVSITSSTLKMLASSENEEYLLAHKKPAWTLLRQLEEIPPQLAYYAFRDACNWIPCPKAKHFQEWIQKESTSIGQILPSSLQSALSNALVLDLSVGSLQLGNNSNFEDAQKFDQRIQMLLNEANTPLGVGGYNEVRPIYTSDAYLVEGNSGFQWRTVHFGFDIFTAAGTPILAPLEGKVHSFQFNDADKDYGPAIILEHKVNRDLTFYTLYGHLSLDSLEGLEEGQHIAQGQAFAKIGDMPINGNWPPHLHFQVTLDILGKKGDFPGVVFPHQRRLFASLCPDPNLLLGIELEGLQKENWSKEKILVQRQKHLGRNLSVSYAQKPLHIQRAFGAYLYDDTGRRYLDTANNVPHVGHQHPRVIRAANQQIAVLNTNTRYLHSNILEYAEELCATLPEELSVCYFVNSGSEANELAVRMARAYTGQKDMLVMQVGYHGNTNVCVDISSYKFEGKGGKGKKDWVHVVDLPFEHEGKGGIWYGEKVGEMIEGLEEKGKKISGFICESILSCAGQIVLPPNYLKTVYQYVRKAGGVCIADEVQVGFGRVGKHFWGFELQGVVPDIVTMGKPIGNGHPLAAVVTTPKVAAAFDNGMEFFNTFGGNPVSCAIGLEVLRIVKEEKLQENALKVGNYLKEGLEELMKEYLIIGEVRGEGLFLGFELVKNRQTMEPAPEETAYLALRMRELGVLLGTDGLYHNVIKIKPPMVFSQKNADFLLETLDKVLNEDFLNLQAKRRMVL